MQKPTNKQKHNTEIRKKPLEYIHKFQSLLDLELQQEKDIVITRLRKMSIEELEREGLAIRNVEGRILTERFFGKPIILFQQPNNNAKNQLKFPFHKFSGGDLVTICNQDPLSENLTEGIILDFDSFSMRVVIDGELTKQKRNAIHGKLCRIDQGVNSVTYNRMSAAVKAVLHHPELQKSDDNYFIGSYLSDVLLETKNVADLANKQSGVFTIPYHIYKEWKEEVQRFLNESQMEAIRNCIARRVTLIQGPPGTGKTHTLVQFIKLLCKLNLNFPILATAYSNLAVDNLLQSLLQNNVRALRIGKPVKVREIVRTATLAYKIKHHELTKIIKEKTIKLQKMQQELMYSAGGVDKHKLFKNIQELKEELKQLRHERIDDIFNKAQVICTTCITAGGEELKNMNFPLVVIDESTQSIEPGCLVPIMKGSRQLVLLGDHFQLPPLVLHQESAKFGLNKSLMERLVDNGIKPILLTYQYRMHPKIAEFPSLLFYEGKIKNAVKDKHRIPTNAFPWPHKDTPIIFINVNSHEKDSKIGGSKYNPKEAEITLKIINLITNDVKPQKIGIISPYAAQVTYIDKLIHSNDKYRYIDVATVDGFQGREKDVILISCVRCNHQNQVGFLSDWRRLNVAITRAKRGLIIIGSEKTLSSDTYWKKYFEWLHKHGLVKCENILDVITID